MQQRKRTTASSGTTACLRLRCTERAHPSVDGRALHLISCPSEDDTLTADDKDSGMLGARLREQEKLGSTHAFDRCCLALVGSFGNIYSVADSKLLHLYVHRERSIRAHVSLSSQFFRSNFAHDAVVVDHGKVLATDTDNDANFVRRPPAAEDNQIVELVSSKFVLAGCNFGRFPQL